jgi:transcriptional regulator with XRE-family HTH domain
MIEQDGRRRAMTIGERIKNRRIELGMSQEELAKKIGYSSRSSINKIELDVQQLRQSKIMDIAKALNTTTAYIMGWDEPEPAKEEPEPLSPSQARLVEAFKNLPEELYPEILDYIEYKVHQYKQEHPE